jgi:hypothetical protein
MRRNFREVHAWPRSSSFESKEGEEEHRLCFVGPFHLSQAGNGCSVVNVERKQNFPSKSIRV